MNRSLKEKIYFCRKTTIYMKNVHTCLLCLGSNMRPAYHLREAEIALNGLFPGIRWGGIVLTRAENAVEGSSDYLNRVAWFDTSLSEGEIQAILKDIEKANGRSGGDKAKGSVPLDVDLLQYDSEVLKPDDFGKDYVRKALDAFPGKCGA